jgi:hypothetical protein
MEEPEIRERWWCAGRALAEGTAALGGGGSDRAEDDLRKEGGGEEVKEARIELVVHGRVGVWRRAVERQRLGEERRRQEGG